MLGAATCILAVALCLRLNRDNGLRLIWTNGDLPATCFSRLMFGIECPGCGLTRSFVALASGDFAESYRYNRVGWLFALAVVVQIPYRIFALGVLRHRVVRRPWLAWPGYALVAAVVINWVLKMYGI